MSSNFFAALDDSDNEGDTPSKRVEKESEKEKAAPPKPTNAEKPKEHRRPNNNDRNTKHGRGGRAPPRDGKRAYDRRSGTGRGREIKKGGGGARNWGSDRQEAENAEGRPSERIQEPADMEEQFKEDDGQEEAGQEEAEPEPEAEDITVSYEDYIKNKVRPDTVAFAPREERMLNDEFAKYSAKVSLEEDFLVMGGGKQKKKRDKTKEKDRSLDVGFRVAPSGGDGGERSDRRDGRGRGRGRGGRGRGDRDARGGGRGRGRGGGRGRGREGRGDINTSDAEAFPSL